MLLPLAVVIICAGVAWLITGAVVSSSADVMKNISIAEMAAHEVSVVNGSVASGFDYSGLRNDICLKEMQVLNIGKIYSNKTVAEQKRIAMTKEWEALVSRYNQHATEDKVSLFDGCG